MCERERTEGAVTCVVQMDKDKERLLPQCFDFVQRNDNMMISTQSRELFGPLPEIVEHRILTSRTKHERDALQSTTAPTPERAQNQRGTPSVPEGGSASSTHESSGLQQGRWSFDEGEVTDLDVLIQRKFQDGIQDPAQEVLSMNVGRHGRGTRSSAGANRSNTDLLQHEESDGVVTDLDVLVEAAVLAIEQVNREAAHGPAKESTGSSTSTGLLIESDLI